MPPHATPKSPPPSSFIAAVHGEWSDAMKSSSPAPRPSHRSSRLAASRIGGEHLNAVAPSPIMDEQHRPEIAQKGKCIAYLAGIQRREVLRARIREEAFEAEYACLVERFEAAQVPGNDAAPEAHVDVALPVGRAPLDGERSSGDGCRDAIERHVHQGRDAAGRGGPGRRREALPLGVARLAQVNMGVDEARQHDDVRTQVEHRPRRGRTVHRPDSLDAAIAYSDGPGLLRLASLTRHDTRSTDE